MKPDFKELQSKTIEKKEFINLDTPEDINLMGHFLKATEFENSYGKSFPTIYYDNGIAQFDKILNNSHEYEYGYTFNIVRYINGVIFFLNHPQEGNIKFGLWPHRIIKYETTENQIVNVLKENKITNMVSSGAWGEGALGVISSIAVGKLIEKIQGIQSTQIEGVRYKIYYLDKNDKENCINFHSSKKSAINTSLFILTCIPGNDESTTLASANTNNKNCYVATSCYGNINSYEVNLFRFYRDNYLLKSFSGRIFTKIYYLISPYLVIILKNHNIINGFIKTHILERILIKIRRKINH